VSESSPKSRFAISRPGAILTILALINFINYVDRQIISPLVPLLTASVESGGLGISYAQAGWLASAFMVVHSLASVPLGILADHFLRKRLIAIGVAVWSAATAGAAFARTFVQLFVARGAVGIGEAAYAPAASALISEKFSEDARARALSVFQAGMMIGGGTAAVLGGQVGGHYGWRAAFLVVGVPGLLLALLALFIHELPLSQRPHTLGGRRRDDMNSTSLVLEARSLARSPAVRWINIAGVLITFFVGAVIWWAVQFIVQYHYKGATLQHTNKAAYDAVVARVSTVFGLIAGANALAGALIGSVLADLWERRSHGTGRLGVAAVGVLTAAPLALVGFFTHSINVLYVTIGAGVFFSSWYVGPILAALHDVVPPGKRGTVTGIYLLAIHLLGDAVSPGIVGSISDYTGSLRVGLATAVAALALGGLAALRAIPESRRLAKLKRSSSAG
jgi:MFS transporter, Spinster family, sphingosine-1-phosphate transporter